MKKYAFRALQFGAIITALLITSCSKKSGCYFSATNPIEINRTHMQANSAYEQPGSFQVKRENKTGAIICE